jgi:protein-L-isoaspartate(D-aspartate) O-methyltransferase
MSPRVLAVMREVPRHLFVPQALRPYAYNDHPLPLGHGQNLASPFVVALMTHLAELEPGDVVFETGTGAGYHAAVLAKLAAEVYSVEVVEPLAGRAAATLAKLGVVNAHARPGDGYYGWADHAPYDAIIVKEAVDHVPVPLLNQLKAGGRMVLPLGSLEGGQYLTVVRKAADGTTRKTRVLPVLFSPLQGGERT